MSSLVFTGWVTLLSIATISVSTLLNGNCALAQISSDGTLPTNIKKEGNTFNITGGIQAGSNLFHSFGEFSVPTNKIVFFNNAADIQNIFSRVTGKSISNIDGLIKANGTANLFLINPNGIIFGQNAQLNIGGSFVGTTASAISFGNQGFFSAFNLESSPSLLTVNPTAFLFNQIPTASIQNNSFALSGLNPDTEFLARGLAVPDGKSLLLIGGDINMNGGSLYALGGRVELGGLGGAGTIGLNLDSNNLSLSFPTSVERSDVSLSNSAFVDVAADDGGSITVNARNLEMTGESVLFAGIDSGLGSDNSKAGNIEVNATGIINLNNSSFIINEVLKEASGQAGNININANTLLLNDGSQVGAGTFGAGKGGNLTVDAQDVQVIGTSASGQVSSGLFASAVLNSTGDAGDLTIKTDTLLLKDGGQVGAGTFGAGKGGNLTVNAQDLQVIGTSANGQFPSGLFAETLPNSTGDAGDLTIKTNTLLLKDGAQVSASTSSAGKGGNLTVDAQDIQIIGRSVDAQVVSALFASAQPSSTGDAGDLKIKTNTLRVRDGAGITVRSFGTGTAGNLTVDARYIRLNNHALLSGGTQSARVDLNRQQATININSEILIMSRNSNIFTNARGENVIGGNINIDTDFLIASGNSDISTNSTNFRGGNVRINAQGIFGTQLRNVASDSTSDITATGASPEFNGSVKLNTPDVNPNSSLVELPTIAVDLEVTQVCNTPGYAQSSFMITGRGGLPPNPTKDVLAPNTVDVGWVSLKLNSDAFGGLRLRKNSSVTTKPTVTPERIVEASGWVLNEKGEVVLIANVPTDNARTVWHNTISCGVSHSQE